MADNVHFGLVEGINIVGINLSHADRQTDM